MRSSAVAPPSLLSPVTDWNSSGVVCPPVALNHSCDSYREIYRSIVKQQVRRQGGSTARNGLELESMCATSTDAACLRAWRRSLEAESSRPADWLQWRSDEARRPQHRLGPQLGPLLGTGHQCESLQPQPIQSQYTVRDKPALATHTTNHSTARVQQTHEDSQHTATHDMSSVDDAHFVDALHVQHLPLSPRLHLFSTPLTLSTHLIPLKLSCLSQQTTCARPSSSCCSLWH